MRRIFTIICLISLIAVSAAASAADLPSQAGLPPELTIASQPPLAEQLQTLKNLQVWNAANRPAGGGFLSGLKNMFGGGSGPRAVPLDALLLTPEAYRGSFIEVQGVYVPVAPDTARLDTDGGTVRISLPQGVEIQGLPTQSPAGLPVTIQGLVETAGDIPQIRASLIKPSQWLTPLRIGRIEELQGQLATAQKTYADAATAAGPTSWGAFARVNAARLAYEQARDKKQARAQFSAAWNTFAGKTKVATWVPGDWWLPLAKNYPAYAASYRSALQGGETWVKLPVTAAMGPSLDTLNRDDFWYKFMDFFVALAGGSHWLGIIFLAVISRVVIWPLTKKQLASAEAMKRLQPQIKALQERFVDDKQKFQEEFWKLCQANGVNPLGGCLPMIIQFPILILLYKAIREYVVQFQGNTFLWVRDLAAPDMGLLIAYTISMVLFQKMTQKLQPTPTMNAQQAQQQQMMTYMMPIMFFFFFQTFPAAFLLYWLATNVVYFAQQYAYTRSVARAQETESIVPGEKKTGGFAGSMARMMSMKSQDQEPQEPEAKPSFHEKQAEAKGKKTARPADKAPRKRK